MKKLSSKDFDEIFKIMQDAFPLEEYRDFDGQKNSLSDDKYNIITQKCENGKIISFIAFWEFQDFIYIEHFATDLQFRGKGIGTQFLKDFIKSSEKIIILEAEPPCDEISKNRIAFYERMGFVTNKYDYLQPPLRKNTKPFKLLVLSLNQSLSKNAFDNFKKSVYQSVYKANDIV